MTNNSINWNPTQYNVLVGAASGSISNIAPPAIGFFPAILTSAGASANPSFSSPPTVSYSIVRQVFTSSGTYTPTSGMTYCYVECLAGGGGGGGTGSPGSGKIAAGSGGGGGEYAAGMFSSTDIGASQSVTIGAAGGGGNTSGTDGSTGGTSSLGALITSLGGNGGSGLPSASAGVIVSLGGGVGGTGGTGGDFRVPGSPGYLAFGIYSSNSVLIIASGNGGGGYFGVGGNLGVGTVSAASQNGGQTSRQYGSGGSGGYSTTTGLGRIGGTGFAGVIIITELVQ